MSANTPVKIQGKYLYWFEEFADGSQLHLVENLDEQEQVVAKMTDAGFSPAVPGFVLSTRLFHDFIGQNELDEAIRQLVLEYSYGVETLSSASAAIRALISKGQFNQPQTRDITSAYRHLAGQVANAELAVKSFVPGSSREAHGFLAQQECELTAICPQTILLACIECFASLYNDAAILYREEQGITCPQLVICVSASG
ncbi:hypothetical protein SG34_008660 [Thalassomonas viridans]|uniref:Phosphoenolpyruvate synthase n=1 Tax=Thalassomonas viridans TaxID=137584 RepID=A0AAF0CAK2_9GAMM|nr:PEP/pyruvate-binding domain-containing protein [Thalassomonas viridans]WDE06943.1 hypothetical protein SG34_008660 [Thalassomonas viridans]